MPAPPIADDTALPVLGQRGGPTARAVYEAAAASDPSARAASLYIHMPFCSHKCHYCDFYSIVDLFDRQEAFADRLVRELHAVAPFAARPLRTIFVGGGTPSLLEQRHWNRVLEALESAFDLGAIRAGSGEFTVECNPESTTPDLLAQLRAGGVHRVSLGAQSFDPERLRTLERRHDPARVERVLDWAGESGIKHRSIDLIYAIPGQTTAQWARDLDTALALPVDHLSAYNLTYEPRTALTARLERAEFEPIDEDTEIEMFEHTGARLVGAGFQRYEVSNYAKPGGACRHNLAYWRQEPWLAAGPSASGHFAGHRWKQAPRLSDYLAVDDAGFAPLSEHEQPDPARASAERLMTGLRLAEGVDLGRAIDPSLEIDRAAFDARVRAHEGRGHLAITGHRATLTDAGLLLADGIAADLMALVDPS